MASASTEDYRITTVEQLRERMGHPNRMTPLKLLKEIDDAAADFIRRAPFIALGTADADGNQDV